MRASAKVFVAAFVVVVVVGCLALAARTLAPPLLNTALFSAVDSRDLAQVRFLLRLGASPNAQDRHGATPLHGIAGLRTGPNWPRHEEDNLLSIAKVLIDSGADVNVRSKLGFVPLHQTSRPRLVQLLVSSGADPNAAMHSGLRPLHRRIGEIFWLADSLESARVLIENGADVNARADNEATPLHNAAFYNNLAGAELLISNGANINAGALTDEGTPLHSSVANGDHAEMAQLLVKHGADLNAKDVRGQTPLEMAERKGKVNSVHYLRNKRDEALRNPLPRQ